MSALCSNSLAGQPLGSTALDVLHHQHAEIGSGDLGRLFVEHWNALINKSHACNEIHEQLKCHSTVSMAVEGLDLEKMV